MLRQDLLSFKNNDEKLFIKNNNFCCFYIIKTKSNWKILFTNSKGNIIVEFSAKSLYKSKRDRTANDSLETLLRFFLINIKKFYWSFDKK